jgi:hypothetical protein
VSTCSFTCAERTQLMRCCSCNCICWSAGAYLGTCDVTALLTHIRCIVLAFTMYSLYIACSHYGHEDTILSYVNRAKFVWTTYVCVLPVSWFIADMGEWNEMFWKDYPLIQCR